MFTFGHDPLASSLDQTLLQKMPFFNDISTSAPSPSFEIFQPYEENYDPSSFLQDLLQHQQEHHVTLEEDGVSATKDHVLVNKMVEKSGNRNDAPRSKRSCKKDRHSKIDTVHGPRDRRMRLSLEVARKFFGLQDMLKFDKASKTVEWLLIKSKSAIEEVEAARGHIISKKNRSSSNSNNNNNNNNSSCSVMMRSTTASSTTSECEVVSRKKMKRKKEKENTRDSSTRKCRSHSSSSNSKIAKESRIKARERARQRTREKFTMMTMMTTMSRSNNYKDSNAENCGENGTQSGKNSDNSMRNPSSLDYHHQVVEKLYCKDQSRANQEMGGNNDSASVGKWSPCPASSTFNCFSSEQHGQFLEFPLSSKPWEGNPNPFLC